VRLEALRQDRSALVAQLASRDEQLASAAAELDAAKGRTAALHAREAELQASVALLERALSVADAAGDALRREAAESAARGEVRRATCSAQEVQLVCLSRS